MQKRVVEHDEAERTEPSWYLTRDGKQYGPLTDRELSLFAEGGNFKDDDLLWTAGLDSWKPARAVFGLGPSPESPAAKTDTAVEANGEADGEAFDAPVFVSEEASSAEADVSLEADVPSQGDAEFSLEPDVAAAPEPESKAADSVFNLAHESDDTVHAVSEPHDEAVDALVQALHASTEKPKPTLKERVIEEAKKFAGIFLYLWLVFTVLLVHEWVVLSQNNIGFTFYGLAAINAVILAKIVLIADNARFASRLKGMPLVYPILYKSVGFTTLLFVAYVLEEVLIGGISGNGFIASVPDIGGGLMGALGLWLIFCVALVPYFAFREIEQAVGSEMFRRLLFGTLPARR